MPSSPFRSLFPYPELIIFVRHAESEGNVLTRDEQRSIPYGTERYKLTARGREQAQKTGEWLCRFPEPDIVLRSYYARTNETAELVFPEMSEKRLIKDEVLLAERDRGMWTEATEEEVQKHMPWEIRRRDKAREFHYRPPGGENFADVERRVREFRRSLRLNGSNRTIAVVGHSHWLLLWQKVVEKWTIDETEEKFLAKQWPANASVLLYRNVWYPKEGEYRLVHRPEQDYIIPWKLP